MGLAEEAFADFLQGDDEEEIFQAREREGSLVSDISQHYQKKKRGKDVSRIVSMDKIQSVSLLLL